MIHMSFIICENDCTEEFNIPVTILIYIWIDKSDQQQTRLRKHPGNGIKKNKIIIIHCATSV